MVQYAVSGALVMINYAKSVSHPTHSQAAESSHNAYPDVSSGH